MNDLLLYFRYLRVNYLAGLQYKGWPMQLLMVGFVVVTDPLAIMLLFARFGSIGGWSVERVMLVYGLALTSFGLAELFSRGYDAFPWQIRTGAFDRILLRPRNTFVQVMGMRFHLHRLSRVVGGLLVMWWSLQRQGVVLDWGSCLQLLLALIGGYLVYTGVFVFSAAITFWTIEALNWIYIFTNGSYQVTKCPPHSLPGWLRTAFTFFMPMLVFSYYPAATVCHWGDVHPALGWLALPAGVVFLLLAAVLWRHGVSHYASTGS